jgi:hypothetical protein
MSRENGNPETTRAQLATPLAERVKTNRKLSASHIHIAPVRGPSS